MFLKKFLPSRSFLFPVLLLLFAFCYYGSYYRCSLYPSGEGGVEGVTALRLLSGKIPIVDVALNYNLLWFYPIVWLFKIVGPSYTALRIFFFTIATMTGLLAFSIVKTITQCRWLALLAGLLALLLPGQLFRNYMAFTVMLNMALFLRAFLFAHRSRKTHLLWMLATGCSLGVAFLIRVDLGFFLSIIFLGLILLSPWITTEEETFASWKRRCLLSFVSFLLGGAGFIMIHAPIYYDAAQRGFVTPFVAQYQQWPHMIFSQASHLLTTMTHKRSLSPAATAYVIAPKVSPTLPPSPTVAKSNLLRPSLSSHDRRQSITALNIYLPIACSICLMIMAGIFFVLGKKKREAYFLRQGWILLVMLGCSLTLFPQYFFWRPDMVHLSEFMVPMTTTLLVGLHAAGELFGLRRKTGCFLQLFLFLFISLAALDLLLYLINGVQSQSTGGIAISQKRTKEFIGANGVCVKLAPHEWEEATAIFQSILQHSKPGEYVVCYPYNPEINFMTDRPSYRRDLYIDDMTAPANFDQNTIVEIEHYQPAVIVITDWPINGTEHSRFSHWAAETYRYIQSHYQAAYEKGIIHVFVRQQSEQ